MLLRNKYTIIWNEFTVNAFIQEKKALKFWKLEFTDAFIPQTKQYYKRILRMLVRKNRLASVMIFAVLKIIMYIEINL